MNSVDTLSLNLKEVLGKLLSRIETVENFISKKFGESVLSPDSLTHDLNSGGATQSTNNLVHISVPIKRKSSPLLPSPQSASKRKKRVSKKINYQVKEGSDEEEMTIGVDSNNQFLVLKEEEDSSYEPDNGDDDSDTNYTYEGKDEVNQIQRDTDNRKCETKVKTKIKPSNNGTSKSKDCTPPKDKSIVSWVNDGGPEGLASDGYLYNKKCIMKSKKYWRCTARDIANCKATLIEDLQTLEITRGKSEHTHPPDSASLQRKQAMGLARKIALENVNKPVNEIWEKIRESGVVTSTDGRVSTTLTDNMRRNIRRWTNSHSGEQKQSAVTHKPEETLLVLGQTDCLPLSVTEMEKKKFSNFPEKEDTVRS